MIVISVIMKEKEANSFSLSLCNDFFSLLNSLECRIKYVYLDEIRKILFKKKPGNRFLHFQTGRKEKTRLFYKLHKIAKYTPAGRKAVINSSA